MSPYPRQSELEVKFRVSDLRPRRLRLSSLGAELAQPRLLEVNLRLDTPGRALAARKEVLRLRRGPGATLTHKQAGELVDGLFHRPELELRLSDFAQAQGTLERLGFEIVMCYEKYREVFRLAGAEISLDELPYGDFVEIEAPDRSGLQEAAQQIGLPWSEAFQGSYVTLFDWLRATYRLPFSDLTFANFAGLTIPELGLPGSASSPTY